MALATPDAIRSGLVRLSSDASDVMAQLIRRNPAAARAILLAHGPAAMDATVSGASALGVDWYDQLRDAAGARTDYRTTVPAWRREEKFARALVWATEPLELDDPNLLEALNRLGTAVDYEVFQGFADTIDENVRADREAVGWTRDANYDACRFCKMLADRGAVYRKESSARFAAHTNCKCAYVPVFADGTRGPEASVIQYQASTRYRTKAERDANNARVRAYLNKHYPDVRG